MDEGIIQNM